MDTGRKHCIMPIPKPQEIETAATMSHPGTSPTRPRAIAFAPPAARAGPADKQEQSGTENDRDLRPPPPVTSPFSCISTNNRVKGKTLPWAKGVAAQRCRKGHIVSPPPSTEKRLGRKQIESATRARGRAAYADSKAPKVFSPE
jgi:hypothetical protein